MDLNELYLSCTPRGTIAVRESAVPTSHYGKMIGGIYAQCEMIGSNLQSWYDDDEFNSFRFTAFTEWVNSLKSNIRGVIS
jgi:hypothetical protein